MVFQELDELRPAKDNKVTSITFWQMLSKEMYFKPLTLSSVALFFREFSAINVVIFYTQAIFKDAGANFDPGAA